jgi:hypothetical protein
MFRELSLSPLSAYWLGSSTVPGQVYRGNTRGIQSHHNPDDGDRDSSRNVGFYLLTSDAVVCLRRFFWIAVCVKNIMLFICNLTRLYF